MFSVVSVCLSVYHSVHRGGAVQDKAKDSVHSTNGSVAVLQTLYNGMNANIANIVSGLPL